MLQTAKNQQMQRETNLIRVFVALKATSPLTKKRYLCPPKPQPSDSNAAILERAAEAFIEEVVARFRLGLSRGFNWEGEVSMAQDRRFGCAKGGALFVLQKIFSRPAVLLKGLTASLL